MDLSSKSHFSPSFLIFPPVSFWRREKLLVAMQTAKHTHTHTRTHARARSLARSLELAHSCPFKSKSIRLVRNFQSRFSWLTFYDVRYIRFATFAHAYKVSKCMVAPSPPQLYDCLPVFRSNPLKTFTIHLGDIQKHTTFLLDLLNSAAKQ